MKAKAYIAAISAVLSETIKQACEELGIETVLMKDRNKISEEISACNPNTIFLQATIVEESKQNIITALKEDPKIGDRHIIVHSVDINGAEFAHQAGADAFLPIPFRKEQLESILRYALNLPKKILMIRSEENGSSPLYNELSEAGFTILLASNMNMGLNITKMAYPDLLICDYELPGKTANNFCNELKKDKLFFHIPITILSEKNDVKTIESCFEAGANDILLPPFESKENIKKITAIVSPHTSKKQKVLVVDDSVVIRNLIANMFKQLGFVVVTAVDGQDGYEKALKEKPDLITSDYDMPRLDGWGMCSKLINDKQTKGTPIIMVTSRDTEVDKKKAKVLGLSSYLTKPFNLVDLKKAANKALEESKRKQEHEALSKYVATDALKNVEKIIEQGKDLEPEEKFITILFTDICGFSSKCEQLSTKKVVDLLNNYFEAMTDVLLKNNAIIDKFIGDAIVARFDSGNKEEDALNAAKAAIDMLKELEKFNRESFEEITIRIGINSGEVILGNLGSTKHRLDYTMIGDNVNIGQRLESQAPSMACLVSDGTYELIADKVKVGKMQELQVKGKSEAVKAYPLISIKDI